MLETLRFKINWVFSILGWFLTLSALFIQPSFGKFSPDTEWETLETEHFRVHSSKEYRFFTSYLTKYLEEAHVVLTKDLFWEPKDKYNE